MILDEVHALDEALTVLQEEGIKESEFEVNCDKCQQKQQVKATINITLDGKGQAEPILCVSCGADLGHYRKDRKGIAPGYSLTLSGVLQPAIDHRPLQERLPEASRELATANPIDLGELPDLSDLKARLLFEDAPVGVIHGREQPDNKLLAEIARKRKKVQEQIKNAPEPLAPPPGDDDDF